MSDTSRHGQEVRLVGLKTMGGPVQVGESDDTRHAVTDNTPIVPTVRTGEPSTARLVGALVVMIEQAHRNHPDGAGTLASSSELRTA